jgi:hypothetical protein
MAELSAAVEIPADVVIEQPETQQGRWRNDVKLIEVLSFEFGVASLDPPDDESVSL